MNNDDLREQQIERYVHGRMSEDERAQFEMQMQQDAVLRSQVNDEMELLSLYDKDLISFKKKLDDLQSGSSISTIKSENGNAGIATSTPAEPGQVIRMKYVWAAAASVALILVAFWFYNRTPDGQQIAMNAAKNDFSNVRSEFSSLDSLFAMEDYTNFIAGALEQLKTSLPDSRNSELKMEIARAYILSGNPQEAIGFIQSLPEPDKKDCGIRYCNALAELSIKEDSVGESLLKGIVDDKCYPYDDKASELMNNLK